MKQSQLDKEVIRIQKILARGKIPSREDAQLLINYIDEITGNGEELPPAVEASVDFLRNLMNKNR